MNPQLLPEKHIRLNETVLGLGACALMNLDSPKSLDALWEDIRELRKKKKIIPQKTSFEDLVLAVDFLYAMRAITSTDEGELMRCA